MSRYRAPQNLDHKLEKENYNGTASDLKTIVDNVVNTSPTILVVEDAPIENSSNVVKSGAVFDSLSLKSDKSDLTNLLNVDVANSTFINLFNSSVKKLEIFSDNFQTDFIAYGIVIANNLSFGSNKFRCLTNNGDDIRFNTSETTGIVFIDAISQNGGLYGKLTIDLDILNGLSSFTPTIEANSPQFLIEKPFAHLRNVNNLQQKITNHKTTLSTFKNIC